ncbi:MAG TPA: heparinase II/III family protein [Chitinophagaceae bacterium]|nr:heparinase II/III family protein [Chitinophagaceae bacterium]
MLQAVIKPSNKILKNVKKYCVIVFCLIVQNAFSQEIKILPLVSSAHPRFVAGKDKKEIQKLISTQAQAKNIYDQSKKNIEEYVSRHQTDSTWIVSKLMMFWKTKSTDVFIKGGTYDHAEGEAPVPTVKFPGMRGGISAHAAPKLEDIMPYMDDPKGLYLVNKSTNQPEWVDISKTGNIIEGINNNIMRMAYTSAVLYWISNEEKYAKFAADLFDTYMTGMQYRKEPFDLSHGHHQTLAGLSSFEVIQEQAIINSLTGIYDYLYSYLEKNKPGKMQVYSDVFRKWADIQIAHGVAFNNWNLMQAKNVLNIALMLEDDKHYADGKGYRYYTNYILNINSQRQWSINKVATGGYDAATGFWNESAGYSLLVLNDFAWFVNFFDTYYKLDLVEKLPVLKKATLAVAQYLFPSGYFASFGDSHYGRINLNAAYEMLANARRNKKPEQEKIFTRYIKAIESFYKERGFNVEKSERGGGNINSILYAKENNNINENIEAGNIAEYITPVFSSSHVSYFALRNGLDAKNGLMVAMSGSKGNHMHAGGISMEMYGKGYVLGPESGIGTNYFQADYAEYYSQFPAHNTVVVDGISAYPVMKSNHGFEVKSSYPASGATKDYFSSVSFGNLYFLEPETNADQTRLTSIIRSSDSTAYYVDIFRSKRKDGKDKIHDYFYHNMGQQLLVNDNAGKALSLQLTEKLSFGGGHLFAYDYLYDKKSITTDKDINAVFKLTIPGKEEVQMNMWIKGEKDREIFSVKSPKSKSIDRMGLPNEIVELPMPTIVARQTGEAWTKPFAVVFEPSTTSQPKSILSIQSFKPVIAATDFVGLEIEGKAGDKQFVFSATETGKDIVYNEKVFSGTYAVISETKNGFQYLFLGSGKKIAKGGYSLTAKSSAASAVLEIKNNDWFFTGSSPVTVTIPGEKFKGTTYRISIGNRSFTGKKIVQKGKPVISFELPASTYSKIEFK